MGESQSVSSTAQILKGGKGSKKDVPKPKGKAKKGKTPKALKNKVAKKKRAASKKKVAKKAVKKATKTLK